MTTTFKLQREKNGETCCLGTLTLPSGRHLRTLEPTYRGQLRGNEDKIRGRTAIPCGTYRMEEYLSPRFHQYVPLLKDVPRFEGVEIHVGNYPHNTEGCILVGMTRTITLDEESNLRDGSIQRSKDAFAILMQEFNEALEQGEVEIEISLGKRCKAI